MKIDLVKKRNQLEIKLMTMDKDELRKQIERAMKRNKSFRQLEKEYYKKYIKPFRKDRNYL